MGNVDALSRAPQIVNGNDILDDVMEKMEILHIIDEEDFIMMVQQ